MKIMQLKAKINKQNKKKSKILQENSGLKQKIDEVDIKEQRLLKKQNLLALVNQHEEIKQNNLKKKSQELINLCDESIKELERSNIKKEEKRIFKQIGNCMSIKIKDIEIDEMRTQVLKDEKLNHELIFFFRILQSKYIVSKAKLSLKEDLRQKQSDQIKSMQKLITNLTNFIEKPKCLTKSMTITKFDEDSE